MTAKGIDPGKVNVILATDCGSTTTKAILIERIDGHYRQTTRGEAPTTVEEPFADVTIGVTCCNELFQGRLDEVAVYSVALPAARVQAHYQAGR